MIQRIKNYYQEISGTYESINDVLTFGLDRRWRKKLVKMAFKLSPHSKQFIDICSGTGQTAILIGQQLAPENNSKIIAADFSQSMLSKAIKNAEDKNINNIYFTLSDALHLPFNTNTFDIITISFATRNLDAAPGHLLKCFNEFHRVLKPGGYFLNLETSQPSTQIIRMFFHLYVKLTVSPMGKWISGSTDSYKYLSESIRLFYTAESLKEILQQAGFEEITWKRFLFGGVALHISRKE